MYLLWLKIWGEGLILLPTPSLHYLGLLYLCCAHILLESEDIEGVNKLLRKAKAQAKWEQIALGLGLSSATITDIREKHRRDEKRLYSSLGAWVNGKEEVRATWRILIRTLQSEDVNESALADKIIAEKGRV